MWIYLLKNDFIYWICHVKTLLSLFIHLVVKRSLDTKLPSPYSEGAVKCLNSWTNLENGMLPYTSAVTRLLWTTCVCQAHDGVAWFDFKISLEKKKFTLKYNCKFPYAMNKADKRTLFPSPPLKLWEQDKSNKGNINLGALFNFSFLFFFFFLRCYIVKQDWSFYGIGLVYY